MGLLGLVGEALVSFWFWFPISFAMYMLVQLYFLVAYGIVSIIPVPFVIILYALIIEERRIKKSFHGIDKKFSKDPSALIGEYLEKLKKEQPQTQ
ncbi:MAG: hypothetical protein NWE78_05700 [Candidatus Bathyarchaeota archaeon]|nr:hypothetical protein [Candidatus Bathyarchaeota archaeon]